jgi:hypothetical protein
VVVLLAGLGLALLLVVLGLLLLEGLAASFVAGCESMTQALQFQQHACVCDMLYRTAKLGCHACASFHRKRCIALQCQPHCIMDDAEPSRYSR